jgi:exopolysaccharide/PEP-CTERM locus tyrosine autokinase
MSIVEKAMMKLQRLRDDGVDPRASEAGLADDTMPHRVHGLAPGAHRELRLDRDALRAGGLLPPVEDEKVVGRQFRRIKRPLVAAALTAAGGKLENGVIIVASAVPGEGKTFTAMNLAMSLALEKDATVLLVDADVAKPHISTALGIETEAGLVDALADHGRNVESLIFDTDLPGLSVLGAGRHDETATELLASERMRELVQQLRRNQPRRIIVFDSSPLLVTTESRELGEIASQIVLVVRAGSTPRQTVYDALEMFPEDKRIGLVLNQAMRRNTDGGYYDYGYGSYGYGSRQGGGRSGNDGSSKHSAPAED